MALRTNCRMRTLFVVVLLALVMVQEANAFVKGSAHTNSRPILFTGRTQLAATKKKAAKKTAAKKKKQEPKIEVETIRKAEIISSVAGKLECTKSEAESALAAVLGTISENVIAGKKVTLAGFGSFQLRARAARKGRNPQTGEEIDIKASNSPGFTAAKAFKEAANE